MYKEEVYEFPSNIAKSVLSGNKPQENTYLNLGVYVNIYKVYYYCFGA